jgi:hypothetical protein
LRRRSPDEPEKKRGRTDEERWRSTPESCRHPYRPLYVLDKPKEPAHPSIAFLIGFSLLVLILIRLIRVLTVMSTANGNGN